MVGLHWRRPDRRVRTHAHGRGRRQLQHEWRRRRSRRCGQHCGRRRRDRIGERWPLEPVASESPDATARRFRYADGAGEIGVIASVTKPFCGACSRARLSAEGRLYTCLFGVRGHDLRALVRGGATEEELYEAIGSIWRARTDRYSELRTARTAGLQKVEMSYIGG